MKQKKTITYIAFLLLGIGGLHAQESPVAAGGKATGAGGTVSYSVGQVVYTAHTGTTGSISQGVQQPYEIYTTVGINEISVNLELSVYPNPTDGYLTLKSEDSSNLSYQLFNIQGKIIEDKIISSTSTDISLESQASAAYFLNVLKNNQVIKTFKIIKN
ncbi:MAG: T9SS type A sorting domain-containing protein [Bacteroidales bacterium]|nr:T9SS type A sorting domain-containing protein [Bacteroidales bacterium]